MSDTPLSCGPWTCDYPRPQENAAGTYWTCPRCGTLYRLSAPIRGRWWRNWTAPFGEWRIASIIED